MHSIANVRRFRTFRLIVIHALAHKELLTYPHITQEESQVLPLCVRISFASCPVG